jgi:HNH endonuclease
MPKFRISPTAIDRFWAKVKKSDDPEGCWLWQGAPGRGGYGVIKVDSYASMYAHRFSYELANGPIPEGLDVLHRCDVPLCVNPSHLWLGTPVDNMTDMMKKGRCTYAKLTPDKVVEIRRLYATGDYPQTELAKQFGVNQMSISNVVTRRSWKHVP